MAVLMTCLPRLTTSKRAAAWKTRGGASVSSSQARFRYVRTRCSPAEALTPALADGGKELGSEMGTTPH